MTELDHVSTTEIRATSLIILGALDEMSDGQASEELGHILSDAGWEEYRGLRKSAFRPRKDLMLEVIVHGYGATIQKAIDLTERITSYLAEADNDIKRVV